MAAKKKEQSWKASIATFLIALGVVSLILPFLGKQLRIVAWMGSAGPFFSVAMIIVALVLFALDRREKKAKADTAEPPDPATT